jgi:Flp pilus assembly protein TadG
LVAVLPKLTGGQFDQYNLDWSIHVLSSEMPRLLGNYMLHALQRFLHLEQGAAAIVFGVAAPLLVGVAGIAVDYARFTNTQSELQGLADGAAVAAAKGLSVASMDGITAKGAVESYVQGNAANIAWQKGKNGIEVTAKVDQKNNTVEVELSKKWSPMLAHVLTGKITTPVVVSSTAKMVGTGKICMIALREHANKALHVLKNATLIADGCAVYSNSTHSHSIWIDNNGSVTAKLICAAGGVKYKKSTSVKPSVTEDCPPIPDPLADRPAPPSDICPKSATKLVINNQVTTLSPGTYCGGLEITGNSDVTFMPGDYIIKDGPFVVTDTSKIRGENTGFYFTGSNAVLKFDDKTSVELTAPKQGPLAGLLFFEDRNAAKNNVHIINSDDARVLLGTIYFPKGTLRVSANAPVADQSAYTAIIAEMLDLDEGPDLVLRSDYGATDIPVPAGLIGGNVVLTK